MSIAVAVKHMLAAGMSPEAVVAAVEEMECASAPVEPVLTPRQARNRRYYENKRLKASENRLKASSSDVSDAGTSLDKERSPTPPKEIKPSISPSLRSGETRAREGWPDDFREQFWAKYPHKVGKPDALRKLDGVMRKGGVTFAVVMAGLDRYIRTKPPDRAWCNPATWINQQRWADQPAEVLTLNRDKRHDTPTTSDLLRAKAAELRAEAADGVDSGTRWGHARLLPGTG